MKSKIRISLLLVLTSLVSKHATANNFNFYDSRISVWGLEGSVGQARGDFLFPALGDENHLFYADFQGNYTTQNNNSLEGHYLSAGGGIRQLFTNKVLGAYLFYDRDTSIQHHHFNVLSPGLEAFYPAWDFRINGYFPLNRIQNGSNPIDIPTLLDCMPGSNQNIFFQGHQEFVHSFTFLNIAGRGFDTEIGYTFHHINETKIHLGLYYFNFDTPTNISRNNITGVESRLEVPINPHWAVMVLGSYDKLQHGALVGGLRFDLFPQKSAKDLHTHMTDPIPRNLSTLKTGTGVPFMTIQQQDNIILLRDRIYFYSASGGTAFVNPTSSGTFENPLSNDQFTQSIVDQIGPNANFYFPTGTYLVNGQGATPNSNINLLLGDSIFGRTADYLSAASGSARPTLLGSLSLPGNNTLASMQLVNSGASDGVINSFTALNIINATNILLCNDFINATITSLGNLDLFTNNFATGIFAENSQVTILNSSISAEAIVMGDIFGYNFAVGIGGNSISGAIPSNFTGNTFIIQNSSITAGATAQTNFSDNFATAIGTNNGLDGITNFNNNNFTISNSIINGQTTITTNSFNNVSVGIGSANDEGTTANFNTNQFSINNSQINANSALSSSNDRNNESLGIGGYGAVTFDGNLFNIVNSELTALSSTPINEILVLNVGMNEALGIGGVNGSNFTNNIINLMNSTINILSSILNDNTGASNVAIGIGNNKANFLNNTFNLNQAPLAVNSTVGGNNSSTLGNIAIGIGGLSDITRDNTFNILNSSLTVGADVTGSNNNGVLLTDNLNEAIGIGDTSNGTFENNIFNISATDINTTATVGTDNNDTAQNLATGIGTGPNVTFSGNTFNVENINVNAVARVNGNNASLNQAVGIGNNGSTFAGNTLNELGINTYNAAAMVGGTNTGTNNAFPQNLTFLMEEMNQKFSQFIKGLHESN